MFFFILLLLLFLNVWRARATRFLAQVGVARINQIAQAKLSPNGAVGLGVGAGRHRFAQAARRRTIDGHGHEIVRVAERAEAERAPHRTVGRVLVARRTGLRRHLVVAVDAVEVGGALANVGVAI